MSKKKILILLALVLGALFLTGCTSPTNADGTVKLIDDTTTFSQTFSDDSWFSALLVFPMAKAINWLTPRITVGGAIAVTTLLVNVIILLFTLKSNIATQQMQTLQPEMDKITRKYEGKTDDRSKMAQAQEMQNLYKKYNINPFATILTTFIQFPIIIAMYQAVQRSSAVHSGTFLGLSLETTPWAGVTTGQYGYIALFLIMLLTQVGSMFLPQLLAKRKAKKEAEAQHRKYKPAENKTQNTMYFVMIPILIISVMWPAAMTLYWIINSMVMMAKTLLVQRIIEKKGN